MAASLMDGLRRLCHFPTPLVQLVPSGTPGSVVKRRARGGVVVLAVLSVALPVFGLILTGTVAGRIGWLGSHATSVLNLFVVYLALPSVLVQSMARIRPV